MCRKCVRRVTSMRYEIQDSTIVVWGGSEREDHFGEGVSERVRVRPRLGISVLQTFRLNNSTTTAPCPPHTDAHSHTLNHSITKSLSLTNRNTKAHTH